MAGDIAVPTAQSKLTQLVGQVESGSVVQLRVDDAPVRITTQQNYPDEGVRLEIGDRPRVMLPEGDRLYAKNAGAQDASVEVDVTSGEYNGPHFVVDYEERYQPDVSGVRTDSLVVGSSSFGLAGSAYEPAGPVTYRAPEGNTDPVKIGDFALDPGTSVGLRVPAIDEVNADVSGTTGDELHAIVEVY